jgi:hypothetical protein
LRGGRPRLQAEGPADRGKGANAAVEERHPDALVIVPPRAGAVASSQTSPTQRDGHIRNIAARGRRGWQAASGYNRRALVEAQIGRYKRVIGNALRSHTEESRRAEVAIADHVLNRMNDLGRPKSVRQRTGKGASPQISYPCNTVAGAQT